MPEADPVEALYTAPPEEFVAARDRLARELRAAGDRAGAARVRALRRPTRAAWALNVAARERPDAAGALADAVERLHDAQRELLEGGASAPQRTDGSAGGDGPAAALRAAEAAVRDAGDDLLAALPVDDPPTVEKTRATLRAAAVDADVLADLVAGRLAHEQVASGFGGFGDLSALALPPSAPRRRRANATAVRTKRASEASGAPAAEASAQHEAADAAAREAAEQERREREAAERAQREREAAERQARIEAARAEADEAERVAAAAGRAVEEAETALAARRAERDQAQARLADARAAHERAEAE